jgi:membrane fusion protein (multidrug efflux system)
MSLQRLSKDIMMNSTNKFTKLLLASSIALASLNLTGCGDVQASADKKDVKEEIVSVPVEVANTTAGSISYNYSSTAVLEAKEEAQVVSKVAGILQNLYVEEGDYVEAGQILAKIEPQRYQLSLNKAKAELAQIKSELNRIEKVHGKNLVSADTYEKLKWQYESSKSALDIAKLNLKETEVTAPISGFIAERYVKVGNVVAQHQQQSMFHIVQQKQLQGIVHLPEQQLRHVKVGQQTSLVLAAVGDTPVSAVVERISPIVNAKTGTFKVTLSVDNTDGMLKSGMFAEVSIKYNTHDNAMLIPRKAVISMDNKHTVYSVADGKVTKQEITVGFQEGQFVEVLAGLSIDSQVVTAGHSNLKDKANVQVIKTI